MTAINKHGVFEEPETSLAITTGRLTVFIRVIEHEGFWYAGHDLSSRTFGSASPVRLHGRKYGSRMEAIRETANDLIRRHLEPYTRTNSCVVTDTERTECRQMIAALKDKLAAMNQTSLF